MTAAMFDDLAERQEFDRHNAALLRRGTLVHLWRPGERPWHDGAQPVIARVKTTRRDQIEAVDLRDGDERWYDVGTDLTNPAKLRWTWEVIAPPERPAVRDGIERIDGSRLPLEERVKLVCGGPGAQLLVRLKNGDAIRGVLAQLIMGRDDDWEAEWVVFDGGLDAKGPILHVVRAEEIAGVTRDANA
jgi:hypothetical protein